MCSYLYQVNEEIPKNKKNPPARPPARSLAHSLTHSLTHSFIQSVSHSFIHSFSQSMSHLFIYLFIHSFCLNSNNNRFFGIVGLGLWEWPADGSHSISQ